MSRGRCWGWLAYSRAPEEAVAAIGRASELNPAQPAYASNLGNVLSSLDRLDEAVIAYRTAVQLRPDFAEAWNNLGIALHRLGGLDEAIDAFGKSLAVRADHPQTLSNLGNVLKEAGEIDEAMQCFERASAVGNDRGVASQQLLASYFHPAYGPGELLAVHTDWGRKFAPLSRTRLTGMIRTRLERCGWAMSHTSCATTSSDGSCFRYFKITIARNSSSSFTVT